MFIADGVMAHLKAVADQPDLSGTRYRFIRPIGRGGMGAVYLAEDTELRREVALKVLANPSSASFAPDAPTPAQTPQEAGGMEARLLEEARIIARLEHPSIVPVHDVGRLADGRVYYAMKYVRGDRLDVWLRAGRPRAEALRMFQRICEAVAFAHASGVVHRDLKPQNLMVGEYGEALVMDWGIAKQGGPRTAREKSRASSATTAHGLAPPGPTESEDTLIPASAHRTLPGTIVGTPAFMSPEQARGDVEAVDERTDVYALGAIAYFLLAGKPPFEGDANEVLQKTLEAAPPPLRALDVPRPLESIVLKALAKSPGDRYATAKLLADDVGRFLDGDRVLAHRETVPEKLARYGRRYQVVLLLIAAYLLMRLLVLLYAGR